MGDGRPDDATRSLSVRWLAAFGRFWWDFLVGDTPELFLGAVAAVAITAALCVQPGLRTTAAFVLPLLVTGVLTTSIWRATRGQKP